MVTNLFENIWVSIFDFCVEILLIPLKIEMTSSSKYCCEEIGCAIEILILDKYVF